MGAWIETTGGSSAFPAGLVAPRVGAWIETIELLSIASSRASHLEWVRGLKQQLEGNVGCTYLSHLEWVRGLKLQTEDALVEDMKVAPRVGAWIETKRPSAKDGAAICRTSSGCVD